MAKTKKVAKTKRPAHVVFKTANGGKWSVYKNSGSAAKRFSVSLTAKNGNELAPDKGFNTMYGVMKHILAVSNTSPLIPIKAGKGGTINPFSMNAYLIIRGS
jgi:hypothetical protein